MEAGGEKSKSTAKIETGVDVTAIVISEVAISRDNASKRHQTATIGGAISIVNVVDITSSVCRI